MGCPYRNTQQHTLWIFPEFFWTYTHVDTMSWTTRNMVSFSNSLTLSLSLCPSLFPVSTPFAYRSHVKNLMILPKLWWYYQKWWKWCWVIESNVRPLVCSFLPSFVQVSLQPILTYMIVRLFYMFHSTIRQFLQRDLRIISAAQISHNHLT